MRDIQWRLAKVMDSFEVKVTVAVAIVANVSGPSSITRACERGVESRAICPYMVIMGVESSLRKWSILTRAQHSM
jgi:hypothetical protein